MFGVRKVQGTKESAARRLLQPKRALTAALIAPALGLALMTPSVAFAAETAGLTTQRMDPGVLTLDDGSVAGSYDGLDAGTTSTVSAGTEEGTQGNTQGNATYSGGSDAYAEAVVGSGTNVTVGKLTSSGAYVITNTVSLSNNSIDSIVSSNENEENVYADIQTSDQLAENKFAGDSTHQNKKKNLDGMGSTTFSSNGSTDIKIDGTENTKTSIITPENMGDGLTGIVTPFSREPLRLINNSNNDLVGLDQNEISVQSADTILTAESQGADIHFNASEGGTVAPGHMYSKPTSASSIYSEHFDDAKSGSSKGATAFADEGYHFVKWVYTDTQNEVSTSDYYKPTRPGTGWPEEFSVTAVFERNTYTVILDANGGTAGAADVSDGPIKISVAAGTDFKLPVNGGSVVNYVNKGYGLSGWDVVRNPGAAGSTGSYFVADGQALDSKTEYWLKTLGYLNLDWTINPNPTVKLFAQWTPGQATYKYTSTEGGTIEPNVATLTADGTMSTETVDALTGSHSNNSKSNNPDGATAIANSYYHFAKWIKTAGDEAHDLTDEAAACANLDGALIKSVSYYADEAGTSAKYHSISFQATFAPNTYRFAYVANEGAGTVADTELTHAGSGAIAASGVARDGYKLTGWNTTANGIGRTFTLGQTVDATLLDELMGQGMLRDQDGSTVTLYAQWEKVATPDPEPEPEPEPEPDPEPEPQPDEPDDNEDKGKGNNINDNGESANTDKPSTPSEPSTPSKPSIPSQPSTPSDAGKTTNGDINKVPEPAAYVAPKSISRVIHSVVDDVIADIKHEETVDDKADTEEAQTGALASTTERDDSTPIVIQDSTGATGGQQGASGDLSQMSAPDAVSAVGQTVGTIAAVGAIAGIVGIGASIAGTTIVGAAAIGTASTAGLSSAADLAADLAANAAGAGADVIVAGKKKKKKDEDDDEPQQ